MRSSLRHLSVACVSSWAEMDLEVFIWMDRAGTLLQFLATVLLAPFFLRRDRFRSWQQNVLNRLLSARQKLEQAFPPNVTGSPRAVEIKYIIIALGVAEADYFFIRVLVDGNLWSVMKMLGYTALGFGLGGLLTTTSGRRTLSAWQRNPRTLVHGIVRGYATAPQALVFPLSLCLIWGLRLSGWYLKQEHHLFRLVFALAWTMLLVGFGLKLAATF